MAVGHDRPSVVDEEAGPRHPRAVFADFIEIEGHILQITILVQAGKIKELVVRQADAIIKLCSKSTLPRF